MDLNQFIDENITSSQNNISIVLKGHCNDDTPEAPSVIIYVNVSEPLMAQLDDVVTQTEIGSFMGINQVYF